VNVERGRVYTLPQAMKATGCSRRFISAAIASGDLASVEWGNRRLMSGAALLEWLDRLGSVRGV
jgi:excisionase family DNA binding protein